jgi:nucleolar GTP-binding protein
MLWPIFISFAEKERQMFDRLPSVPSSQDLLNKAFRRASRAGKRQDLKISTAGNVLAESLMKVVRGFPSLDGLPPFYREMLDILVGADTMRISLSRLQWASRKVKQISKSYVTQARGGDGLSAAKAAFGRMSSVIKSIDSDIDFLREARKKLREMPTVDSEVPTIIIAGYPNVGKSSFLARITGARPEIARYPFTTKGVNVGHFTRDHQRYQVLDTPGLLDRPLEEKNAIERQTIAALSFLPGVVLFILDPSGHCGYPLASQLHLAESLASQIQHPMLVVANKADLAGFEDAPAMSTLTGEGVARVLDLLISLLRTRCSA